MIFVRTLRRLGGKGFNLRLIFALCSFGTITLASILSAYWVSSFLTQSLLEREGEVAQEFLESYADQDAATIFADDGVWPRKTPNERLLRFATRIINMPGMVRVNLHAPNHRILWSTEKQIVGEIFEANKELDAALRGERTVVLEDLEGEIKSEHVALDRSGKIIEAYIPIHQTPGKGPIVGVVEFYKYPLLLSTTIARGQQVVWASAAVESALLFIVLYWIVHGGARIIENQQTHMAQMEAFAAIGQMSSAVAHSLRNPMSAIRSSAELWRGMSGPAVRPIVDEVIGEVDRMEGYVRDLLAYARSDHYHLQPVDPVTVLERIIANRRPAIERNGVSVAAPQRTAASVKVMADELLLEQALTSIVTNAIEAMPDGGTLSLSVDALHEGGRTLIEIGDTGQGIPAELVRRVSESYFTTKARGLGLGLVLARSIIERCQGRMDLASVVGTGTRVTIELSSA